MSIYGGPPPAVHGDTTSLHSPRQALAPINALDLPFDITHEDTAHRPPR